MTGNEEDIEIQFSGITLLSEVEYILEISFYEGEEEDNAHESDKFCHECRRPVG